MKFKLKKKDAKIIRNFLGGTSTCDITEFCEKNGFKNGTEIDDSLFMLYKALENTAKPEQF